MTMVVAKIILDDSDGRYVMYVNLCHVLASGNLNNTTCFILNSITEVKIVVDVLLILNLNFYILLWIFRFYNSLLHQSYKTAVTQF